MADGFLSRWSRRKIGKVDEPLTRDPEISENIKPAVVQDPEAPPPASLEDVEKIDRFDPDFSAFMKPDVDPVVQQAALKKMFTDPHFNIMDGLDIYIDDYSKPDPLPPGMLERMVQSDMLNLFRQPKEESAAQAESPMAASEDPVLAGPNQTDLTSTDSSSSVNLTEIEKIQNADAESVQKKNT